MNYIVFDLEWNQSPKGKAHTVKGLPFEIVEIGAVKLNEQLQVVDERDYLIQPQVYLQLHYKIREMLSYTIADLMKGQPFQESCTEFFDWCGQDCIFCTWGNMDLSELQRNMEFYDVEYPFPMPLLYYDLQKLYSLQYQDGKDRSNLQGAIEQLQIPTGEEYHRAINDARYSALIMQKLDLVRYGRFYSVDTYRIPAKRNQEIHLNFGSYEKYISKGFLTREKAVEDREVRSARCFLCGAVMKRRIKWFSNNAKSYYGAFCCPEHGLIKGRFRVKQADNGQYFIVRVMKRTDEAGVLQVQNRQKHEQEHRRQRREAIRERNQSQTGTAVSG